MLKKPLGIYVHIPFCAVKCPYCDFYSVKYKKDLEQQYVNSMINHIYTYKDFNYKADTLYFGGGTPSLITSNSIEKIILACNDVFSLDGEITLEGNPNSITRKKLTELASIGVNRLSCGMQSTNENELVALGRKHSVNDVYSVVENAICCEIENISLDLMLGTPYQTINSISNSINTIVNLPIKHISAYMLKVEENTPYFNNPILNNCIDEDGLADIYLHTVDILNKNNFLQYEISNFAKEGYESKHNLKYWCGDEYIGFGASAHSFLNNQRFYHPNSVENYILTNGTNILFSEERETDLTQNQLKEYIMLRLRLSKGIDLIELNNRFGVPISKIIEHSRIYISNNYANINNNYLSLTPMGMLISNSIIIDLIQNVI